MKGSKKNKNVKAPGSPSRLYEGSREEIIQSRGWRVKFNSDEIYSLRVILKKKYSDNVLAKLESAVERFINYACSTLESTPRDEFERAVILKESAQKFIDAFSSGHDVALVLPRKNLNAFIRNKMKSGEPLLVLNLLSKIRDYSGIYAEENKTLPKRNKRGGLKWFAFEIRSVLSFEKISCAKHRSSIFYRVLQVCFQLLGYDAVKDPYKYLRFNYPGPNR